MSQRISKLQTLTLAALLGALGTAPALAKTFELGAQEKSYLESAPSLNSGASSYPEPQMIQQAPQMAAPRQPKQVHIQQNQPRQLISGVSQSLPPGFLGTWQVAGSRTKVEAPAAFQQQAEGAFTTQTNDSWTISGSPAQGYQISSSTGAGFQLWVDKVANGVAFIRYQHPVKNTMAQEAVVMQLGNGGSTFSGLERISIIKQEPGQPPVTRCKVQYALNGHR